MKENLYSLERKLNEIIDIEFEKSVSKIDDRLIMECCDGMLRMDNYDRYIITEEQKRKNIDSIFSENLKSGFNTTKTIRIMLIAAIIIVLLAIGSFGYAQYKYNIFNFSDHSTIALSPNIKKEVYDLQISYIPDGFVLKNESGNKYEKSREYIKEDNFFVITKQTNASKIDINTEYEKIKVIQINGNDYIEFGETEHGQGFAWEENGYRYVISGNISKQELIKIAISTSDN